MKHMSKFPKSLQYSAFIASLLLSLINLACSKQETVTQYDIPKESSLAQQTQRFQTPKWQVPNDWIAQAPSSMRKGSWKVQQANGQAEISVLVFPGDVGGEIANINRWRAQIGLGPEDATALQQQLVSIKGGGHPGTLINMRHSGKAIIGAIVPLGSGTWFFKMNGAAHVVTSQQQAFRQFLDSIQFP